MIKFSEIQDGRLCRDKIYSNVRVFWTSHVFWDMDNQLPYTDGVWSHYIYSFYRMFLTIDTTMPGPDMRKLWNMYAKNDLIKSLFIACLN